MSRAQAERLVSDFLKTRDRAVRAMQASEREPSEIGDWEESVAALRETRQLRKRILEAMTHE